MKLASAARGSQEAGFTQPIIDTFALLSIAIINSFQRRKISRAILPPSDDGNLGEREGRPSIERLDATGDYAKTRADVRQWHPTATVRHRRSRQPEKSPSRFFYTPPGDSREGAKRFDE